MDIITPSGLFHPSTLSMLCHFFSSTNDMNEFISRLPAYLRNSPFVTWKIVGKAVTKKYLKNLIKQKSKFTRNEKSSWKSWILYNIHFCNFDGEIVWPWSKVIPNCLEIFTCWAPRRKAKINTKNDKFIEKRDKGSCRCW